MGVLLTLLVPAVVAAAPLIGLLAVSWLPVLKSSASLTALVTLGAAFAGCVSTMLAMFICAVGLARGMQGQGPECVTGAAVFLPIGALFTLAALLVGGCLAVSRAVHKQKATLPERQK